MGSMSNTRKEIAERLGFAAKSKFERVDIGDAFEFEGKVYVVNGKASEISALLSSSKNNSEKAMMLASYAHEGTLSYEGKRKMSRPGVKAKFGVSSYEQAENQIALTEERIASYRRAMADTESWIKRANAMMSKADVGDEKAINEIIGIARMLETNMKSRGFSRPGAKAEMAKWESTLTKKYGKPIEEYTARLKGGLFKIEVAEGTDGPYAVLYRWDDLRGAQRIASGNLQSLMRQAESMGAKEARGVAAIERISNYSRFGAKEKFATSDELFRKLRLIYAYIDNEANDISDKQMSDWKKIVDEAMSSGDENIKRLAKRVKDAVGFSRPGAKAK